MKIVVGMDGSDASIEALRFAADEAETLDADLTAVTVWEMPPLALGYVSAADASGASTEGTSSGRPNARTRRSVRYSPVVGDQ